jgi:hypothetical protein
VHRCLRSVAVFLLLCALLCAPGTARADSARPLEPAVTIATSLTTDAGHIRQFAFDGNADTYFASLHNVRRADHFTLVLDKPVVIRSVTVTTGRPAGEDKLDSGVLEMSRDGKKFDPVAKFTDGVATARLDGRAMVALRLKPSADLNHALAIREIAIESDPPLRGFKYPVEFAANVDDAPEMKAWAEKVARICERAYPMINEELRSPGFKPPTRVTMTLKEDYRGVAATAGSHVIGSVKYFKQHPEDVGAMVHETVHVCQRYRGKVPGWLVEGIADYIRFYKYEPGKLRPLSPNRARYDASYQVTARFLEYVTKKYDKELVRKLNQTLREGEYRDELFKQLTGKALPELNEDWRASLRR